ncbi:rCG38173 [Rattus norvegicus]|uniref:RCG38173 n=1 Tax=Rattus norvegicus TaxID=10116 RepID=A6IV18_RAT|nr:rCG38173 [Rattus norvegicus]
MPLPNCEY